MFLFIFCSGIKFLGLKSILVYWDFSVLSDFGFKVWNYVVLGWGGGFLDRGECE